MANHATTVRHELESALTLPPREALQKLKQLEQDCQQLAEAQAEGMQGAEIGSLLERIQADRKRLEGRLDA